LGVGANGTVLTAASGEATGLQWAAPAGGGADWSLLIAGGTLTGAATITVSGISGKNQLFVIIDEASSASTQSTISIRFNTDSGVSYTQWGSRIESTIKLFCRFNYKHKRKCYRNSHWKMCGNHYSKVMWLNNHRRM
jgi:hypothetical protein